MKEKLYRLSPDSIQPLLKRAYYLLNNKTDKEIEKFIQEEIGKEEFSRYQQEIENKNLEGIVKKSKEETKEFWNGKYSFGEVNTGTDILYALIRIIKPDTIVETGVCNGVSTLYTLAALSENEKGKLYSVDYPLKTEQSIEKFRKNTFDGYGGAAIPKGREPGWIIPEKYRERWNFRKGKSQIKLPELRSEINNIDIFIHDSEHSLPCMMFEFEIAWNWMKDEGIIFSDDIGWNKAFKLFNKERDSDKLLKSENTGILRKSSRK